MDCNISYSFETANDSTEKLRLYTSSKHKETKISHKWMHQKHVENLKLQLKNYNYSSAVCISTGQKINFSVLQGLLHTVWNVSKYGVFSGPYFPPFALNTERYFIFLRIQFEWGKIRTRKNFVFGHFSRSAKLQS